MQNIIYEKVLSLVAKIAKYNIFARKKNNKSQKEAENLTDLLSQINPYIDSIPCLPMGEEGHKILKASFISLITVLEPKIFCDIGANDGNTSILAKSRSNTCRVVGFEANPLIYANNVKAIEGCGIEWMNLAISDASGQLPIYAPKKLSRAYVEGKIVQMEINEPGNTGKTSLLERDESATYERFDVQTVTLDEFFCNEVEVLQSRFIFLWIDVEGASAKVLSGAEKVLDKTIAIFIETEGFVFWKDQILCNKIIQTLRLKGFVPIARDREYDEKQFNILFIHESAMEKTRQYINENKCDFSRWIKGVSKSDINNAGLRVHSNSISVLTNLQNELPVLVPCFNNPTYSRMMMDQLRSLGFCKIILIDNASTLPSMREYISHLISIPEIRVILLEENLGPRHCFTDERTLALLPRRFCVTDPDLKFNNALPEGFIGDMAVIAEKFKIGKVGFALEISDHHLMDQSEYDIDGNIKKIWEWEGQFWKDPIDRLSGGDCVYRASVDSTFALYDQEYFKSEDYTKAFRIAGRFTARHLPWYPDSLPPKDELDSYIKTQRFSYYCK